MDSLVNVGEVAVLEALEAGSRLFPVPSSTGYLPSIPKSKVSKWGLLGVVLICCNTIYIGIYIYVQGKHAWGPHAVLRSPVPTNDAGSSRGGLTSIALLHC